MNFKTFWRGHHCAFQVIDMASVIFSVLRLMIDFTFQKRITDLKLTGRQKIAIMSYSQSR